VKCRPLFGRVQINGCNFSIPASRWRRNHPNLLLAC
jgi:hypothetical protein